MNAWMIFCIEIFTMSLDLIDTDMDYITSALVVIGFNSGLALVKLIINITFIKFLDCRAVKFNQLTIPARDKSGSNASPDHCSHEVGTHEDPEQLSTADELQDLAVDEESSLDEVHDSDTHFVKNDVQCPFHGCQAQIDIEDQESKLMEEDYDQ